MYFDAAFKQFCTPFDVLDCDAIKIGIVSNVGT